MQTCLRERETEREDSEFAKLLSEHTEKLIPESGIKKNESVHLQVSSLKPPPHSASSKYEICAVWSALE